MAGYRVLFVIAAAAALTACEMMTAIRSLDGPQTTFVQATPVTDPPLPEVIGIEVPVPVPANLKRIPQKKPKAVLTEVAIRNANREARQKPAPKGFLNAIQVYDYMPGALYHFHAAPGFVTAIALQPGEEIITVSAGDTVRWVIGETMSGSGTATQSLVLVKPVKAGLNTNIVITTNRGRIYMLEGESISGNAYNAALTWNYPHDELARLQGRVAEQARRDAETIATGVPVDDLNFGYSITGDNPRWRPERVFDDGQRTFIQFPPNLGVIEAPPLFVVGGDGEAQLVNYRVKGNMYIVDRLIGVAELRLGEDPQTIVRIERSDTPVVETTNTSGGRTSLAGQVSR